MNHRVRVLIALVSLCWAWAQPASPYAPSPYVAASGEALVLRPDGGFVVAGVRREPQVEGGALPDVDLFLAWLDATGAVERLVVLGSEGDERLGSVALDAVGNVYVGGGTAGVLPGAVGEGTQFVAKVTADGEVAWIRQLHGGEDTYPAVVALSPEGELLVAGSITTGKGKDGFYRDLDFHWYYDAYLARLGEDGEVVWFERFAVDTTQFPTALVPLTGGEVAVLGMRSREAIVSDVARMAYGFAARFTREGELLSTHDVGYEGGGPAHLRGAHFGGGDLLVTFGTIYAFGLGDYEYEKREGLSLDAVVGRWNADGELVWAKTFGAGRGYVGMGVAGAAGGEVVVVGFGNGDVGGAPLGLSDAFVVAYTPDGERLWARRFGSPEFDVATAVTVAPDGVIYVTGHTWGRWSDMGNYFRAGEHWFLTAYSSDGERLWLREHLGNVMAADAESTD